VTRSSIARRLVLVGVVIGVGVFARQVDRAALGDALARARVWPLAAVIVLHFAVLGCKAACWAILLAPRHRVGFARLWRCTIAAFAASAIAPLRAGEALRAWALRRRDGVPLATTLGTAICEKVLDAAAMCALALPAAWVLDLPRGFAAGIGVTAALASTLVISSAPLARRAAARPDGWLARIARAVQLPGPRRATAAFAALVAGWLIDLAMVELVLSALDASLPPAAAVVVLLAINLAILVPAMPAQLGTHEAGEMLGLSLFHVPPATAATFAVLYHALQVIPLIGVGLVLERGLVLGLTRRSSRAPREPAPTRSRRRDRPRPSQRSRARSRAGRRRARRRIAPSRAARRRARADSPGHPARARRRRAPVRAPRPDHRVPSATPARGPARVRARGSGPPGRARARVRSRAVATRPSG
jgi:uncharacterized membrane protein YbhN (UPF0104 family)